MNRKAQFMTIEIFVMVAVVFAFALIVLFSGKIFDEAQTQLNNSGDISSEGQDILNDLHGRYDGLFDNLTTMLFIFLFLGFGIVAFFMRSHPAFLVVSVIILLFLIILAGIYSNIFEEAAYSPELADQIDDKPITQFLFSHFVLVMIVAAIGITILLYGKFT